jgi:hypothetical protein
MFLSQLLSLLGLKTGHVTGKFIVLKINNYRNKQSINCNGHAVPYL